MENKNKGAASALCAKGGKAVAAETPDEWSAVGPWNQNIIITGENTAPCTIHGVQITEYEIQTMCWLVTLWGTIGA